MRKRDIVILLGAGLMPSHAQAHGAEGLLQGFGGGFLHPFGGIDHIVVLIVAGLLAARIGGSAVRNMPMLLTGGLAAGALLGLAGLSISHADPVAAAIALALAGAALYRQRWLMALMPFLFFAVGVSQGYLHGANAANGGADFILGLLFSSGILTVAGTYLGAFLDLVRARVGAGSSKSGV